MSRLKTTGTIILHFTVEVDVDKWREAHKGERIDPLFDVRDESTLLLTAGDEVWTEVYYGSRERVDALGWARITERRATLS